MAIVSIPTLKRIVPLASVARMGAVNKARQKFRGQGGNSVLTTTRKRKRVGRVSFRQAVLRTLPAKHWTAQPQYPHTHNSILSTCPSMGIVQGSSNSTREGDRVHMEALKIKGTIAAAPTAGAYSYRVIVGWSGEEFATGTLPDTPSVALGGADIFLPNTYTTWYISGIINPKAFTVLYDKTFDINSNIASTSDVISFGDTIPLNTEFSYQSSNSVYGKTRNLYYIIVASVVGGAGGNIGTTNTAYDLIFKD